MWKLTGPLAFTRVIGRGGHSYIRIYPSFWFYPSTTRAFTTLVSLTGCYARQYWGSTVPACMGPTPNERAAPQRLAALNCIVHLAALRARKLPELVACWTGAADERTPAAARSAAIALAEMRQLDERNVSSTTGLPMQPTSRRAFLRAGSLRPLATTGWRLIAWSHSLPLRRRGRAGGSSTCGPHLVAATPNRALRLHAAYAALTEAGHGGWPRTCRAARDGGPTQ